MASIGLNVFQVQFFRQSPGIAGCAHLHPLSSTASSVGEVRFCSDGVASLSATDGFRGRGGDVADSADR